MRIKATSIPEYIAAAPEGARERLLEMYGCLREVAPGARESIKWGVPTLSYDRILFTFAAFKNHVSLYPTPAVIGAFAAELAGYEFSGSAIKFPLDRKLPLKLIRRVAALRVRECVEKDARWMGGAA